VISKTEATRIAAEYLHQISTSCGLDLMLIHDQTLTTEFGWVFVYDSKAFIETSELRHRLAGNAPFIVDMNDGSVHETGTAEPIENYLENYRRSRSRHRT